jgi:hypothetical protein
MHSEALTVAPLLLQLAPELVEAVGHSPDRPFTVHLLHFTQQEAPQSTRFLGLPKNGLHDRFALGVGLLLKFLSRPRLRSGLKALCLEALA